MSSTVDKIKERLNIVDVVGSYLKLERAGVNWKTRCPFHQEKTPSFFVSPARESYHCFGCNQGGDIFSFVQEIEGLDFLGSLRLLAERAGVEIEATGIRPDDKYQRLYRLLEAATEFYRQQLAGQAQVLAYLTGRGLTETTIKDFSLGYAPVGWRQLTENLLQAGYSEIEIETAGLAVPSKTGGGAKGSRYYDRFRGRVMFPLFDTIGRVVGFSGRLFPETEKSEAKYINTPQTPLYDKSKLLYGFDRAKVPIRRTDQAVLVEGQMDLVLSHQAGVDNVVAVSGTALTETHLIAIKRLASQIVMAFDQDLAGVNAARRAIDLALDLGFEIKVALLPEGQDPAEVIKTDPAAWRQAIAAAKHIIDFYLAVLLNKNYDERTLRLATSREVLPYIRRLANAIDQAHFVGKVAQFLNLPEDPIWQEVRKISHQPSNLEGAGASPELKPNRQTMIEERLLAFIFWAKANQSAAPLLAKTEQGIIEALGESEKNKLLDRLPAEIDRLALMGEFIYAGLDRLDSEITELLVQYRMEILKAEMLTLLQKIRQAESAGDHAALDNYVKKCQAVSQILHQLGRDNQPSKII